MADAQNVLPGLGDLGRCVNIFERYRVPNRAQLFPLKDTDSTFSWNGMSYAYPKGMGIPQTIGGGSASFEYFQSRQEFSRFFAAKAEISGNYRAFDGEFSAAFSVTSDEEQEYSYSLFHIDYQSYQLTLDPRATLDASIAKDPFFTAVPEKYSPELRDLFYRFFARYGTHYITSVTCGARLYMYSRIEKSYNYSKAQIDMAMSAEYNALFGSVSASASANWQKVDKNWFEHQKGFIEVLGGDPQVLSTVIPQVGDNKSDAFNTWLGTILYYPSPRDFVLRPIFEIFPAEKRAAVELAIADYAGSSVLLEVQGANTPEASTASISAGGYSYRSDRSVLQPGYMNSSVGGLIAAVYDRKTLVPVFRGKTYDIQRGRFTQDAGNNWIPQAEAAYKEVLKDLAPYSGNDQVIVALLFWSVQALNAYPSPTFHDFMRSMGAQHDLDNWLNLRDSGTTVPIAYGLVGVPNSKGIGIEVLTKASRITGPYPNLQTPVYLTTNVSGLLTPS
jgi:hypothetical protein